MFHTFTFHLVSQKKLPKKPKKLYQNILNEASNEPFNDISSIILSKTSNEISMYHFFNFK